MTDSQKIAELLFAPIDKTPDFYENAFPLRSLPEGAMVTRFAPSPTGFLHIGGLFAALVSHRLAAQSGGRFLLRIEDTDKKREVTDGVSGILSGLMDFGIVPDEGVLDSKAQSGDYGPYLQGQRKEIYHAFAKNLVEKGLAYPCFCKEEEITEIRAFQEKEKLLPGYYGEFAKHRNITAKEAADNIKNGLSYVLRLKSCGDKNKRISFKDLIKGTIEMPENIQDIVLLKSDGIPTYHFAHAVDDHLMRTTHVIRGDEWISSTPIHLQLFFSLGLKPPKYAHIAPIMKEDGGGKRKISKRKDPEASVSYYTKEGYPSLSVIEYLLNLANYTFEDWRRQNKDAPFENFKIDLKKMSQSGALFDLAKLCDISRDCVSRMTASQVLEHLLPWSFAFCPTLFSLLSKDTDYAAKIFSIDRYNKKPRKDIAKWSEVSDYISYFYDQSFTGNYDQIENLNKEDIRAILDDYKNVFDPSDDKETWFHKIKDTAERCGFAREIKEFKNEPLKYKGHVGDVSTVIRIAVTGRSATPDLFDILGLLGRRTVCNRIHQYIALL